MSTSPQPKPRPSAPPITVYPSNGQSQFIDADEEAEKCVLGSLLTGPSAIQELEGEIDPRVFFVPASRIILSAIVELYGRGVPIDIVVLTQYLRDTGKLEEVGGASAVTELATRYDKTTAIARYELSVLRELSAKRRLIQLGGDLSKTTSATDICRIVSQVESAIDEVKGLTTEQTGAGIPWDRAIAKSVVTSTEIANLQLQLRKQLLGDWFCEGDQGMIYAYRGVGKTWLGLLIAKALSQGGNVGPWQVREKIKVLYIDGEMALDLMKARDRGLSSGSGDVEFLNHEVLFERAKKVLNITRPEIQRAITGHCLQQGIKLVVLDNLSTLASGMKENDADAWEQVHNWLLEFRRHRIAIILIHHAGRNGEARGTSKREDANFWVIALDDAKKQADDKRGARFISRFTKPSRNTQEEIPAYEWHVMTDNSTGEISVSHKVAQSLDVFRRLIEEGVTDCTQLAEEMKVSKGQISKWAKKAMVEGWLKKDGREYALVDGNKAA
jgi:hypothetical protein